MTLTGLRDSVDLCTDEELKNEADTVYLCPTSADYRIIITPLEDESGCFKNDEWQIIKD
jgi:hypothetical protein